MAREFLMLAHVFDKKKHRPIGWYASEKLDGMRCFYDGGISRGLLTTEVPWANTAKDKRSHRSTGLWTRYGKSIQAPDWFLDKLPKIPLDGELWMGRKGFQSLISTVKDFEPGPSWKFVEYKVFDTPSYFQIFAPGEVKKTGKTFNGVVDWLTKRNATIQSVKTFKENLEYLNSLTDFPSWLTILPQNLVKSASEFEDFVNKIVEAGGEGVMLRAPNSFWAPTRSWNLLKYKAFHDSEAEVIGFTWGRETDLGSKLLGKMGAMLVRWNGLIFKLSGFTDDEREIVGPGVLSQGITNQGEINIDKDYKMKHFEVGSNVTFTYRELSDDGVPKEARFLRKRDDL